MASRPRTHEAVVQHIQDDLSAGRLSVGGRLPGERGLAEQLGVSRTSVREAIKVLEAMGLIRTAVGSGPQAGAVVVAEPEAAISAALRLHLASSHLMVVDIIEARILLESWAARRAAARCHRRPELLGPAGQLLAAMATKGLPAADYHRLDAELHVELIRLADNPVVTTFMTALRHGIESYVVEAVTDLPDWPAVARRLSAQHRAVVEAMRRGDGDTAARLLVRHIEGFARTAGLSITRPRSDPG